MRIRAIKLMALTTGLLVTGFAAAQFTSSTAAGSDRTAGAMDPPTTGPPAESAATAETTTPTTRPERGPSALENTSSEVALSNRAVQGVIELLQAGVEEEVLLKHIQGSPDSFNVSSADIVYLTDLGAPGHVISAMMDRDSEIQSGQSTSSTELQTREPWPPAGTVAEVPAVSEASYASATLPVASQPAIAVNAPDQEISVDYFYDSLAPYGTWIDVPEYGLCWQPTVAVSTRGWMPYGDRGRWVYTDYGWYWYSDYSWGWAAFHYGRWFHHTQWGWCWAPGTVWGPSWVSWRYSDPYCGWAPLPPYRRSSFYFSVGISWGIPSWCYTYVPSYRICNDYPRKYAVHYDHARRIHGKSRIRNHYAVGRNHTIENRGIPPKDLTDDVTRDIRRAKVKARHELPAGSGRRERLDNDGNILTVYQPRVNRNGTTRPQAASRAEPRATTRDLVGSSRPDRGQGGKSLETTIRESSRNRTGRASNTPETIQSGQPQGERTPTRSRGALTPPTEPSGVAAKPVERSPTVSVTRSEPSVRERSVARTTPDRSPTPSRNVERQRHNRPTISTPQRDSSLIIIGRKDSQRTAPASTSSRLSAPDRSTPATSPPGVAKTPTRSSPSVTPTVQIEPRRTTPPTRAGTTTTRTEPARSITRSRTITTQTPRVTRVAPTASRPSVAGQSTAPVSTRRTTATAPQFRTQPTRPTSVTPSTQRIAPPRTPTRSISRPSVSVRSTTTVRSTPSPSRAPQRAPSYAPPPSTRSAPSVRSAPSASRAPQRAAAYTAPPSTRAAAPTAPRSAPRSAPPGRSGNRSGGQNR